MIRVAIAAGALLLTTATAHATCRDTPENRQACGDDVQRMCFSEVFRGMPRVVACLQHNRRNLSRSCAGALNACERGRK